MNSTASAPLFSSQKITGRHFDRLAVVYVRQSTLHQVQQNQESTQLQYGLANTAERLGWPRERILVIDDDLGVSVDPSVQRGPGGQASLSSGLAVINPKPPDWMAYGPTLSPLVDAWLFAITVRRSTVNVPRL
jgi:hypothetical protein